MNTEHLIAISSASGRERFTCARNGSSPIAGRGVYSVDIRADFWDRSVVIDHAALQQDIQVHLPQVILADEAFDALANHLEAWLVDGSVFECLMTPEGISDQVLTVMVGSDPGLLCSVQKPAFVVCYSRGAAMVGRWAFLVDQTCIRGLLEGLTAVRRVE